MNDASVEFSQAAAAAAVDLSVADGVLPDRGTEIVADLVQSLDDHLTRLDAVDDVELPLAEQVDLEIVRGRVAALRFDLVDVARHRRDPLQWSPIPALTVLTEAEFSTVDARVTSAKSRLAQVPEFLTMPGKPWGRCRVFMLPPPWNNSEVFPAPLARSRSWPPRWAATLGRS